MHSKPIRYADLFRYRGAWMAFAILWVMLLHSGLSFSWLYRFKSFGYGGVDIFFFASGLGCYHSLQAEPDPGLFLAKRARRLLPAYYLTLVVWGGFKIWLGQMNLTQMIGNVLCIGLFANSPNQFNWYMTGVWLSYLLAPFLVSFVRRHRFPWLLAPLLVLAVLGIPFFHSYTLILISRLPVFYLGILFAKIAQDRQVIRRGAVAGWIALSVLGFVVLYQCFTRFSDLLWPYGLCWYPFLLIVPGLCMLLSLLCARLGPRLLKLLNAIGASTLELFLLHVTVFEIVNYFVSLGKLQVNNRSWLLLMAVCCPAALAFAAGMRRLSRVLSPHKPYAKAES